MPSFSIVLTGVAPAHMLPGFLDSILQQDVPSDTIELVVVSGEGRATSERISSLLSGRGPRIRGFDIRDSGNSEAKNLGILASVGRLVCFLEVGDRICPGFVSAHLRMHAEIPYERLISWSRARAIVSSDGYSPFSGGLERRRCSLSWWLGEAFGTGSYLDQWGVRNCIPRSVFLTHGFFNPLFTCGFEDVELCWRYFQTGLRFSRSTSARIAKVDLPEFSKHVELEGHWGFMRWWFSRLHLATCVSRYCGVEEVFAAPDTAPADLALKIERSLNFERMIQARSLNGFAVGNVLRTEATKSMREALRLSALRGVAKGHAEHLLAGGLRWEIIRRSRMGYERL